MSTLIFGHPVSDSEVATEFAKFIKEYRSQYDSLEETVKRYNIFADNYRRIVEHNLADKYMKLGVNQLADMTQEEASAYLGLNEPLDYPPGTRAHVKPSGEIKSILNWKTKGAVTRVKNQGKCGSCWAFTAVGALEGLHAIKKGSLVEFSEQELVDCTLGGAYGNKGCHNGRLDVAFQYVIDHGISKESAYEYKARNGKCLKKPKFFRIKDFATVEQYNHDQLLEALNIGPVAVAVNGDSFNFYYYTTGIIHEDCGEGREANHAVLLVGAGVSKTGILYWIVKNSWGTKWWGKQGYGKILRRTGKGSGVCKIASYAAYPVLD